MKKRTYAGWLETVGYLFLVVAIGITLYQVLGLQGAELVRYPITYIQGGDTITGQSTMKSMVDNGWIYKNAYLGAPYGVENYDSTTMELFLNLIQQCLVWITGGNWVFAYNLFYLGGYFLAGITAYYALRKLDIAVCIAAPTAVLYAFAPYHFYRNTGHIYLGMYFMVPIMVLYVFRLMKDEMLFQKGEKGWITGANILRVITLMIMALTGIYYAFFVCFFLCVVILYQLLNGEGWKKTRQAFLSIGIIVGTLVLAAIPNLIYWSQNGQAEAIAKGGEGVELYALKIIQLLLPIPNHRLEIFMRLRNLYDTAYPLINENSGSSLGIYMAAGFVILCVVLFMPKKVPEKSNLRIGSVLNLAAVLFGTVGGFAVILSFVTGSIRCYNRFSIFIAMFALIGIDSVIQLLYEKWCSEKLGLQVVATLCMIGIMLCGIYDQTVPVDSNIYSAYAAAFEQDEVFVQAIEDIEADGAMIYQMPYMKNPENGSVNQMQDYAHLTCYLHSDTLRWSYGALAGREGDRWMQEINALPLNQQIDEIQKAGFAGIYIDWDAYLPDERAAMEEIFAEKNMEASVRNADGSKCYYSY